MTTTYDAYRSTRFFGSLDGVRALSILLVIWHHVAAEAGLPLAVEGRRGVDLFFVISGFLITTLLIREREAHGDISLRAFYLRRSLRIFPLYYAVLLVYVGVVYFLETNPDDKAEFFSNLKFYATYTSNLFVGYQSGERVIFLFAWSLAAEEQFYLVWPFVQRYLGRVSFHAPTIVALILIAAWALITYDVAGLARTPDVVILAISPAICVGAALAHVLHQPRLFEWASRLLGLKYASAALLLLALASLSWPALLNCLFIALFVAACVVREDHALARVLKWRPLRSIGMVSYGIYLMHLLCLNAVERALHQLGLAEVSLALVFVLTAALAWGVAWLSFHLYEKRWLALKPSR